MGSFFDLKMQGLNLAEKEFNPFIVDDSVNWREKVREFEDARKKVRREEREAPVYKQHTYITRTMGGNIPKIRSQFKKLYPLKPIEKNEDEKPKFDHNEYNEKRSSTLELIQLQREIFHSKFSIQTKRGVIEKLKLKSLIAEKKMAEAERGLFQDNMLFDDFLQETHQAASEAMAQADAQAQKHKEKCKKIKQVNSQCCEVRADVCTLENIAELMEEMKEFIFQVHTNRSRLYPLGNACEEWKKIYRDFETKVVENLPFDSPTDLLETIVELEDRNFSLIGHFEQSEEDFDEIQRVFKQTEQKIDSQIEQLKSQKELMENTVERLLNRSEELQFFCEMFETGDCDYDQDNILANLEESISHAYSQSIGMADFEMNIDSLTLLTFIETRIEDLIDLEETLNQEHVKAAQKEREKERRIQARVKKAEDAENTLKMRLQKQKDRNLTNQGRKKGRRLVVRSKPLNVKEKKIVTVIQEKDTDAEFFTY